MRAESLVLVVLVVVHCCLGTGVTGIQVTRRREAKPESKDGETTFQVQSKSFRHSMEGSEHEEQQ